MTEDMFPMQVEYDGPGGTITMDSLGGMIEFVDHLVTKLLDGEPGVSWTLINDETKEGHETVIGRMPLGTMSEFFDDEDE